MITTRSYHIFLIIAASLLACMGLYSCSQDEFGTVGTLPSGRYPLRFTATVDGMISRTDGKDSWVDGDSVGVKIGADGVIGCYRLNADGTVKETVSAISWLNEAYSTVTAWYPFEPQQNVSISDQTAGLEAFDYLVATEEDQTYKNQVRLTFRHKMAKVTCRLVAGDGVTEEDLKKATVSFAGYTDVTFREGTLSGSGDGWIATTSDYEALLVPQRIAGKPFIKINHTVTVNGMTIHKADTYTPTADEADLTAGMHYTYIVTVKRDRIEVASISAVWSDEGSLHEAGPAIFHVKILNLPAASRKDLRFSDNVTPKFGDSSNAGDQCDYLIVKGQRFSISFDVNDNTVTKALIISDGGDRDEVSRTFNDGAFTFSCCLYSEEITLTYGDFAQEGDLYFSDGTWASPDLNIDKEPIGIVFKSGVGGLGDYRDKYENYGGALDEIHGYAVALHDASPNLGMWGLKGSIAGFSTISSTSASTTKSPYTGYIYTEIIKKVGLKDYWAFDVAVNYDVRTPKKSSGWYLPSTAQLADLFILKDRAALFEVANGEDFRVDNKGRYWSAMMGTTSSAHAFNFTGPTAKIESVSNRASSMASNQCYVRSVLTF